MPATKTAFNPVTEKLLVPFTDEQIRHRLKNPNQPKSKYNPEFSFVAPEDYRKRLLEVFEQGYEFEMSDYEEGKVGVRAIARFNAELEGVIYSISVGVFEHWTRAADTVWSQDDGKRVPNPKAGEIIQAEQTFAKLASAGIKAVSREMGLGLHLYDKAPEAEEETPAAKPAAKTATKPAAAKVSKSASDDAHYDPEWDGTEEITFGKHKRDAWSVPEDSYLEFITKDPEKANKKALKEIARRAHDAGEIGASRAAASLPSADDDEEFPFD